MNREAPGFSRGESSLRRTVTDWIHLNPIIRVQARSWSIAFFWADTPYHAYHWINRSGQSLGVYFDVHRDLTIDATGVRWWDLAIDYWVGNDGVVGWLGEDQVPADLSPDSQEILVMAKEDIERRGLRLADSLTGLARNLMRERGLLLPL